MFAANAKNLFRMKYLIFLSLWMLLYVPQIFSQTSALEFNGSNQAVSLTNSTSFQSVSNYLTIEAWVKANSFGTEDVVFMANARYSLQFNSSGNIITGIYIDGSWGQGTSTTALTSDRWYHVALTYDGDKIRFYVNGIAAGVTDIQNGVITASDDSPLSIGGNYDANDDYFDGIIDEVRIWNVARTEAQIQEYICEALSGSESGLVAYYQMSNGSGTSLTDNSGNANTGTLVNSPLWVTDYHIPVGNGTSSETPYLIAGINNLYWLSQNSDVWDDGAYFQQTIDIDMLPTQNWDDTHDGTKEGFLPIGNFTTPFTGSYDGQDKVIDHLYIERSAVDEEPVGLFGYTSGASLENIIITNIDITGYNKTGSLVGNNTGSSTITSCSSSGEVNGHYEVGGLVGRNDNSTIVYCWSGGHVYTSWWNVGGMVGTNWDGGVISNSYSRTRADGNDGDAGGFVGYNHENGTISNCYSTGVATGYPYVGGFAGHNAGSISNSFWDSETCWNNTSGVGLGNTGGVFARETGAMKTNSTFTDAGWDFTTPIWSMVPNYNEGYPNLDGENPAEITWDGSTDSDWNTAANWTPAAIPTINDNVSIPATAPLPAINSGVGAYCYDLTVNSSASLTVNSGGSLITYGSISNSGSIIMNRDLTDDAWHLISIPTTGITANTFLGDYLQTWSESSHTWSEIIDPATPLNTKQGYSLWSPSGSKASYSFTGTPLTGDQETSISYTSTSSGYDGANLLGNPYPSSIDWDEVSNYGAVYYWDQTQSSGDGAYLAYPETGGYGTGSRYVPPMQGFFIVPTSAQVSTAGGEFTFTNAMRTHSGAETYYKEVNTLPDGLMLYADNGSYRDKLLVRFNDAATVNMDQDRDAWKFPSNTPGLSQLWSVCPDGNLSIDVRPPCENIQLGFTNDEAGVYRIGIEEIADIPVAILEDTKEGIFHNLQQGPYSFAWELNDSRTRFILHLSATAVPEENTSSLLQLYASGQTIYIRSETHEPLNLKLYDLSGRILLNQSLGAQSNYEIPVQLTEGIYIVQATSGDKTTNNKVWIR